MNPLLAQLTARHWAMDPRWLQALADQVAGLTTERCEAIMAKHESRGRSRDKASGPQLDVRGGVAVIPILGTILPALSWWEDMLNEYFGVAATGLDAIREQLDMALGSDSVKSILLYIDSPGGVVDGVADLADQLRAARERKPIHTHYENLGASAAVWLGSQASSISANRTAQVGSIGVYTVIRDTSAMAEEIGIKVRVVSSGPYKGTGVPGTAVTDAQLEPIQEIIDGLAAEFVGAVAQGRGADYAAVQKLATGRTWLAPEAASKGLIDQVATSSEAIAYSTTHTNSNHKDATMSDQTKDTKKTEASGDSQQLDAAAIQKQAIDRLKAMEAAFPNHRDFARTQWEKGASVEQATFEHYAVLKAENDDLRKQLAAANQETAKAKEERQTADAAMENAGADPVKGDKAKDEAPTGDPVAAYEQKVAELIKAGDPCPERTIATKHPALHSAYIDSANG